MPFCLAAAGVIARKLKSWLNGIEIAAAIMLLTKSATVLEQKWSLPNRLRSAWI